MRDIGLSVALVLATVTMGLLVRFAPLGFPQPLVKYGGSGLWALMIYWVISSFLPLPRLFLAVSLSGVAVTGVEVFKLYHSPALDAFRVTLPGALLLGRFFSVWDLTAYWLAIAVGAFADHAIRAHGATNGD